MRLTKDQFSDKMEFWFMFTVISASIFLIGGVIGLSLYSVNHDVTVNVLASYVTSSISFFVMLFGIIRIAFISRATIK